MQETQGVVALARVLAHETCVRLIDALGEGEATVSDLATRLHLDQPRISTHLGYLREAGLVTCQVSGRHRVYALRGEAPALALNTLRQIASGLSGEWTQHSPAVERAIRDDAPIRRARTCYDHLAGVAGVQLMDGLVARHWVEPAGDRGLLLTAPGGEALARAGIPVEAAQRSRRAFAYRCPDWTERRPHVAGALGNALLMALLDSGRARLRAGDRAIDLEPGEPARFLEEIAAR